MTTDIQATLAERGKTYGKFAEQAAISQELKLVLVNHLDERGKALPADQAEALGMICHKIARIINGDNNYVDSWHDIAGYATLVADHLRGDSK
jgi:hypothetical protein